MDELSNEVDDDDLPWSDDKTRAAIWERRKAKSAREVQRAKWGAVVEALPTWTDEHALALIDEQRRTNEKLAALRAQWMGHDRVLPLDEVVALAGEHRTMVEQLAMQKALWHSHLESAYPSPTARPDPMADPNIVAYYQAPEARPRTLDQIREANAAEDRRQQILAMKRARVLLVRPAEERVKARPTIAFKPNKNPELTAWNLLRNKVTAAVETVKEDTRVAKPSEQSNPINDTRSEAMTNESAANGPAPQVGNGGSDEPVMDRGAPPPMTKAGREAFERAQATALADPVQARQSRAGAFALARAVIDKKLQPGAAPSDEQMKREAQMMKRVADTAEGMMTAPHGSIPGDETMKQVVAQDLKAIDAIESHELRQRARQAAAESRIAQPAYDAEFKSQAKPELLTAMNAAVLAREVELANWEAVDQACREGMPKIENTIEPAPVATQGATTPSTDDKTRLNIPLSTANLLTTLPVDGINVADAAEYAREDVDALNGIKDPGVRERALDAIAKSVEAQPRYKMELEVLAPTVAAEAEARALTLDAPAPKVENTIEPAPVVTMSGEHKHPPQPEEEDATVPELDAAALQAVADARARDREIVRRQFAWNTIERAPVVEHKPAVQAPAQPAPAAEAPAAPVKETPIVPEQVERAYRHVGNKFYMPRNQQRVAFEDHGEKLKTALNDVAVTVSMVQIAQARGWTSIKVNGTPEFCKEAWRQATMRGMTVEGYKPTALDLADVARRTPEAKNQMAATAIAPVAATPTAQPGVYVSSEDAALLAAVKASRWGQPSAPSPAAPAAAPAAAAPPTPAAAAAPAAPELPGDKLVAHGAAKYQHNKDNPDSYYVVLENAQGKQRTIWGVRLGEAIAKAGVNMGDRITLEKNGKEQVVVDTKVKDEAGRVVGTQKVGAVRNEWTVKAHAFTAQPAIQAVQQHPELAGAFGVARMLSLHAEFDGLSPQQRAIVEGRVRQNIKKNIEQGAIPNADIKVQSEAKRGPQMEMAQ